MVRAIAKTRAPSSSSAGRAGQPAIRNVTSVAIASRGVRTSTPGIAASRSAAPAASAGPRAWIQSSPTYIDSQPIERAMPDDRRPVEADRLEPAGVRPQRRRRRAGRTPRS